MKKLFPIVICFIALSSVAQISPKPAGKDPLKQVFLHPPEAAKPWVFWYWMQDAVSREGITADLKAMKQAGIGGAYLMPIKGPANPPYLTPPVVQLSPQWWAMVKFTMQEADRIGVKLAMHDCDGFALAGGPWITPELSMQKVVWAKKMVDGGKTYHDTLPTPAHYKDYYKDIEVLAYPSPKGAGISSYSAHPTATTSVANTDVQYLAEPNNKKSFSTADAGWVQLVFDQPFTCRSLVIHTTASNYQSERLLVQASDDGKTFRSVVRLDPPRHGWQDGDADITNDIPETTAKYFRLIYDKAGSEPGSEDLDFAKWKPSLKISGIELSAEAKVHQYESKTGEVWRVSKASTTIQLPYELCIPKDNIINITNKLGADGKLNWDIPAGQWTIIRIGHTSTGHTNATGGGGIGLECDKFSPEAAKLQFNSWFAEAIKQGGSDLAKRVLKIFHVDSWECGSQNWSPVFAAEFKKRRGYDLLPYLPLMAGVPIQSAEESEKVLSDVRETIAEVMVANFYGTMAKLAHDKGCEFTAESVAPTMVSDGMLHYSQSDIPMGEFWFRSPTHDKPNDMLDAISGGHIYGKNIIQAEAFTSLRLFWDEHPAMFKAMADRNFALGINRYVFHVDVHNPWLDRKPGMTLDGIGTFFNRDQTWWKPGKAWFDYIQRCQVLLQQGHPVADVAVFTGEETPRRAVLPSSLINILPGIFGEEAVKREAERMANKDNPIVNSPEDASHSANMETADLFTDPLRGYTYDSFNKDALLRLATVKNGHIVLPGGGVYGVLVIPGQTKMDPTGNLSSAVKNKLAQFVAQGAKIIYGDKPYQNQTFDGLGIARDFIAKDSIGGIAKDITWTHRTDADKDIYFISNQQAKQSTIEVSLRSAKGRPELWDALTGEIRQAETMSIDKNGRMVVPLRLEANGSIFIVVRKSVPTRMNNNTKNWPTIKSAQTLDTKWQVGFDPKFGGPDKPVAFNQLDDWSARPEDGIKYYSGTATYKQAFNWKGDGKDVWLDLGKVNNLAEVYVNGVDCGVAWIWPYRVNIGKALKTGVNQLVIEVSNTWANRLIGDHAKPEKERITWTNAAYRLDGKAVLSAGLLGPVTLVKLLYDKN